MKRWENPNGSKPSLHLGISASNRVKLRLNRPNSICVISLIQIAFRCYNNIETEMVNEFSLNTDNFSIFPFYYTIEVELS